MEFSKPTGDPSGYAAPACAGMVTGRKPAGAERRVEFCSSTAYRRNTELGTELDCRTTG